jgi:hypothetical protein
LVGWRNVPKAWLEAKMVKSAGLIWMLAASSALAAESQPASAPPGKMTCAHVAGHIDGPFVPTSQAARSIYLAVRSAITPWLDGRPNVQVKVEDSGDHWDVFADEPVGEKAGQIVVTKGGGDLSLQIDKCSGAVSNAFLMK